MRIQITALAFAFAAGVLGAGSSVQAAELKLLASNAVTDVVTALLPEFERTTGHKVIAVFEPTNAIMARIKGGEASDVVILIKQPVEDLASQGVVAADSKVNIAKTSLGLSVRAGIPKPDISTADGLRKTLTAAKAVAASDVGASGIHFIKVLDKLGIAEAMKPKLIIVKGATRTASLVAKGEADVAIQMMSELLPVEGAQVVGPLPGDLHFEIVLVGALRSDAKEPAAGATLLKYLSAPSAGPVLKKLGMEGV